MHDVIDHDKIVKLLPWCQRDSLWERCDPKGKVWIVILKVGMSSNPARGMFDAYVYAHRVSTVHYYGVPTLDEAKRTTERFAMNNGFELIKPRLIVML